ncbi:hypothetical protein FE257_012107 [Aspergillus nanangensis]|uniref:SAP domain-containing protein n=1 Tax=Aspergillus nanangensis TaxID=2582783 RepID=A0AAD4CGF1_ASPNN|nr:hypothetical protein FE257_012107 [Aspergillus nanangensis]
MIGPPHLPPRPAILHGIEWSDAVSLEDARLAYRFWSLPDSEIQEEIKKNEQVFLDGSPEHDLARTIYEHLGDPSECLLPVSGSQSDILTQKKWTYTEVLGEDQETTFKDNQKHWTVSLLRKELSERGLTTTGKKAELLQRLDDDEKTTHQILRRSNLSHWGIPRSSHATKYAIRLTPHDSLSALDMYTSAIQLSPYNPAYWLSRAHCHFQMMFFDLAIGDAYRAELLCEALTNPIEKKRIRGLEERVHRAIEQHLCSIEGENGENGLSKLRQMAQGNVTGFIPTLQKAAHHIISLSLLALQCWDDFDVMEKYTIQKFRMSPRDSCRRKDSQPTTEQDPFSAVCGKDWGWLHNAMRPGVSVSNSKLYFSHTNEVHGTLLSLLLRGIFDITLLRRQKNPEPYLMAHELDELLILDGPKDWKSEYFPFTLAANIQVPFDILMQLGVDIFSDLSFDTWVIQIVLRKLLAGVIPDEEHLREPVEISQEKELPSPEVQHESLNRTGEGFPLSCDPAFRNLYLFPGLSIFNRACWGAHNAEWGYDPDIPNRMLVWTTKDLQEGDEIRIPYMQKDIKWESALRGTLGQDCSCEKHQSLGVKRKCFQTDLTQENPRKKNKPSARKKAAPPTELRAPAKPNHSYNLRSRKICLT